MRGYCTRFKRDESGAVTTDFIVLVGAVVMLGLATANAVRLGAFSGGADIKNGIDGAGCVTMGAGGTTDLTRCN